MATIKSDWVTGRKAMPSPSGSEVVNVLLSLPITAAQTALNDIYLMGELPEDTILVDAVFAATDIDTGTAAHVMSFGEVNAAEDDLTTALQAGVDVGKAGTATRLTHTPTTLTLATTASARKKLGYKVTTAADAGAAGTVYLSLSYRSTSYGA